MLIKKKFSFMAAAVLMASGMATADADSDALLAKLKGKYPETTFSAVSKTPMDGIYQVMAGKGIGYTNEKAEIFIFGNMIDLPKKRNLTEEARRELSKVDWNSLPLDKAIKVGNGKRKLAVFTDPDCPYCKRLENTLATIKDTTVYVFMMPLEGLHPDAPAKSESVWCAKDKARAWSDLMLKGIEPSPKKCANPVAEIVALGEKIGARGTPFLINERGQTLPGAAEKDRLEAFISN